MLLVVESLLPGQTGQLVAVVVRLDGSNQGDASLSKFLRGQNG